MFVSCDRTGLAAGSEAPTSDDACLSLARMALAP
jgi:hypothetical protein